MPDTMMQAAERTKPAIGSQATKWLEVTADVVCVPLSIVNVYLYGQRNAGDRSWVLIDAGLPFSHSSIMDAAQERFGQNARPSAIVLTHGHFDHVGALLALADQWEVPVYAHPLEFPYLTGRSSYPPPDPAVGGGAMSFLSRLYPRGPIDLGERLRPLPIDGTVPGMPGWRWIHTPGHTPGHVSFFRDADRLLIAGDAFVTQRQESALAVLWQPQEVCRPPAYFTPDWSAAERSVAALAQLRPNIAATGHGIPMRGVQMLLELNALVQNWQRDALPSHGRYVREPAIADENGVQYVPPPVVDPQLVALAGAGIAVALGIMAMRSFSGSDISDRHGH